eukprot:gene5403-9216_t
MNESVVLVELIAPDENNEYSKLHSFSLKNGKNIKLSSSGIILNQESGIILISGNLFYSFLNNNNEIIKDVKFNVHFDFEQQEKIEGKLIKILYSNSVDKWVSQICSGSSEWFWYIYLYFNIFSGWKDQSNISPSLFGILKLNKKIKKKIKNLKFKREIKKGEEILIIGSPFGIISKLNFKNNYSKGIISNIIGKSKNHFIITDGRILPGNEGGGIFNKNEELISICTIPLKRRDISIELNLGICLLDLYFDEIKLFLNFNQNNIINPMINIIGGLNDIHQIDIESNSLISINNQFKNTKNSLALIHIGYSWSSGIIISDNGYILTNAHLIKPFLNFKTFKLKDNFFITIKLEEDELNKYYDGELIFISMGILDLAILKIKNKLKYKLNFIDLKKKKEIKKGEDIYVIGYPLFNPNSNISSTITKGILSNICNINKNEPCLLQSTAMVHQGNSGGILLNKDGMFLGIITSNLKFKENDEIETLIPSVNFSIPIHQLNLIYSFLNDGNMNHLLKFNKFNKKLKNIWEFNDQDDDDDDTNDDLKNLKFLKFIKSLENEEFKESKL